MSIARVALLTLLLSQVTLAGDWPQILGPQRDGKAADEQIVDRITAAGAPVKWQYNVGQGFAGPAVVGQRVIVFHRVGNQEVVDALAAETGERLWRSAYSTSFSSAYSDDDGPRCVPTVWGDRVFVFGAEGQLHCLSLSKGETLWSKDTHALFNPPPSYFGAGSSPIVIGDKLLVNVGGRDGAGIVAFDVKSGKTLWKSTDDAASYSSPVAASLGGKTWAIFITRLNALSIDPETGKVGFQIPFGKRGPTVNGASPVVFDGHVLLTASYGIGAVCAKTDGATATELWSDERSLSSQYPTPIFHKGWLYGIDGREDIGVADFKCMNPLTGKVAWSQAGYGMAAPILADGKLVLMNTDGTLELAALSSESFQSLGKKRIANSTVRALPALSRGKLYLRDTQQLKCVDLSE